MKAFVFPVVAFAIGTISAPALAADSNEVGATTPKGEDAGGASERRGQRFLGERRRRDADGRWSGSWRGRYDGGLEYVYEGTFDGSYRGSRPHWRHRGEVFYDSGEIVTRTTYQPVTTTTVTETEEWVPEGSE